MGVQVIVFWIILGVVVAFVVWMELASHSVYQELMHKIRVNEKWCQNYFGYLVWKGVIKKKDFKKIEEWNPRK